jgi:hypothetical protein
MDTSNTEDLLKHRNYVRCLDAGHDYASLRGMRLSTGKDIEAWLQVGGLIRSPFANNLEKTTPENSKARQWRALRAPAGACSVDGGLELLRRLGSENDCDELFEFELLPNAPQ